MAIAVGGLRLGVDLAKSKQQERYGYYQDNKR